ncbi:MAG TPA: rRNA maturation RNase YbeY [Candidatus Scybalousia intestinigallinarum]|nr:rRNA maturation RNase YbeY [Candidatus Scybalousia intestinigallinarum]
MENKNTFEIFNETSCDLEEEMKQLREFIDFVLKEEKLENVEFNIIFIDNPRIHEMNLTYRGVDRPTDVISFALEDNKTIDLGIRLLGDIYISIDKAKEQAVSYGHSLKREISFLAVHGLLHLLGYDHMTEEEEKVMFTKQEELLQKFQITR